MVVSELLVLFGIQVDPKGGKAAEKMLSGVKKLAIGLGVGAAVRGIINLTEHTTEAATHLVSLSTAMGLSVEKTQLWGAVASQSGSNLKELSVGVGMYARNLKEFANGRGGKALAQNMAEMGITRDAAKKIVTGGSEGLNSHLLEIADKMKALGEHSTVALSTMQRLFGVRAGRAMLADLARGSEGIKEVMAKREAMGLLTKDQAFALRDLGNGMKNVRTALSAMADQAIARMAPALLKMAESAVKWIETNKDLLSGALSKAVEIVADGFSVLGTIIEFIGDHTDAATAGVWGLAAAFGALALRAAWVGREAMLMWIKTVGPTALVIAAFVLLSYGVIKLREHFGDLIAILGGVAGAMAIAWVAGLGPIALVAIAILGLIALAYRFKDTLAEVFDTSGWNRLKYLIPGVGQYFAIKDVAGFAKDKLGGEDDPKEGKPKTSAADDWTNIQKKIDGFLNPSSAARANVPASSNNTTNVNNTINQNVVNNGIRDGESAVAAMARLAKEQTEAINRHTAAAIGKRRR